MLSWYGLFSAFFLYPSLILYILHRKYPWRRWKSVILLLRKEIQPHEILRNLLLHHGGVWLGDRPSSNVRHERILQRGLRSDRFRGFFARWWRPQRWAQHHLPSVHPVRGRQICKKRENAIFRCFVRPSEQHCERENLLRLILLVRGCGHRGRLQPRLHRLHLLPVRLHHGRLQRQGTYVYDKSRNSKPMHY